MKYLDPYNEYLSRLSPEVFESGAEFSYLEWLEDQLMRGVELLRSVQWNHSQGVSSQQDDHDAYMFIADMGALEPQQPHPDDIPF